MTHSTQVVLGTSHTGVGALHWASLVQIGSQVEATQRLPGPQSRSSTQPTQVPMSQTSMVQSASL